MSKLFDTLEQIRENEEAVPHKPAQKSARAKKQGPVRPAVLIFFVVIAVLCAVLYFVDFSRFKPQPIAPESPLADAPSSQSSQAESEDIAPQSSENSSLVPPDEPQQVQEMVVDQENSPHLRALILNNIATRHIQEKDHWKGISILEQARELYPDSPDILINYGVALTELGIYEVAALYFEEAYRINPTHPALIKNIAILNHHNIMGEKLMSLYEH